MRFGLVLGRLAILKKQIWGQLSTTFEGGFFMFSVEKNIFFFFFEYCSVHTKKLHKMKVRLPKKNL